MDLMDRNNDILILTYAGNVSSNENQKGINAVQQCSTVNQKGALLNNDNALLFLNWQHI